LGGTRTHNQALQLAKVAVEAHTLGSPKRRNDTLHADLGVFCFLYPLVACSFTLMHGPFLALLAAIPLAIFCQNLAHFSAFSCIS
jgi:hypothetical protein